MVDSTKGIGQIQSLATARANTATNDKRAAEKKEAAAINDKVEISQEALSLTQANEKAREVRETLEKDESQTLGLNPSKLDEQV